MKVRDDLADAFRLAWEHIAQPGSWWTAAQRVELANTAIGAIRDIEPLPPPTNRTPEATNPSQLARTRRGWS